MQDPAQVAGQKRKLEVPEEAVASSLNPPNEEVSPKKKTKKAPKPKKPLDSRFGGKTEEELMQLFLPDHLQPDLDIVFIGINPGLLSAYLGHHYCNANNHFWPCMYESGLIPRRMTYKEDAECLQHGIGFTNIVPRTTRSSNDLTKKEIKEWSTVMIERMKELRPLVACFNGKGIYEIFIGKKCEVGLQPVPLPDTQTAVYVMPSTSGRAASHPRRVDKLKFFHELKQLRDNLLKKRDSTVTTVTAPDPRPPNEDTQSSPTQPEVSVPPVVMAPVAPPTVNPLMPHPVTMAMPPTGILMSYSTTPVPIAALPPSSAIVSPYFTSPPSE